MERIISISDDLYKKILTKYISPNDEEELINAVIDSVFYELPKYHGPIVDLYDVQAYDEGKINSVSTIYPSNCCRETYELHRKDEK